MAQVDYIIVGQGLAGSCLALELTALGNSVRVIDAHRPNTASKVAAGLFNPITGKTMETTWLAHSIFKLLPEFYRKAEATTGARFLHQIPIYRPFLSQQEWLLWENRQHDFVDSFSKASRFGEFVHDPFGGLQLKDSGFLNTTLFLDSVRKWLHASGSLVEQPFVFQDLDPTGVYQGMEAKGVIFCEGVAALHNPLFGWLPIKKLKGEILTISTELPANILFNRGVFAVPGTMPNQFVVGATYQNTDIPGNTFNGVEDLTRKANSLFVKDREIIGQNWGFRPSTPDRRPLLGRHPRFPKMMVFNGLGTKGVSLAPYFSGVMAKLLLGVSELPPEVNIARYYSLSFKAE